MKRTRTIRSSPIAVLFGGLLLVWGCTEDSISPKTGDPLPPDFSAPESTLTTLSRGIAGKNPTNYMLCFSDTLIDSKGFHATFDSMDVLDFQNTGSAPPADWTRPQESSFFNQFIGSIQGAPRIYLLPDVRPDGPFTANRVFLNRKFRVYIGPVPLVASSIGVQLERVNPAGEWKITAWEDRRDTSNVQTYGTRRLRGR